MYRRYVKRLLDAFLSLLGLLILWPVFFVIAIAVKIDDPGAVFFSQKRAGRNGTHFQLYKFRTMKTAAPHDTPTHLLSQPDRYITRVGRFLRKTSLDELPQLLNILRGQMAIVGPRPALWNQYDLLAERDKCGANALRPGLTGWAQINGRDELSIAEKAALDGEYAQKISFFFDCKCFLATFAAVLHSRGVAEGGPGLAGKMDAQERSGV